MENQQVQQKQVKTYLLDQSNVGVRESTEADSSYQFVIKELNTICSTVKKDPKIDRYLNRINLTALQIQQSFEVIIRSLTQLYHKAKETKVMKQSINKSWQLLQTFLKYKSIERLDSKEKTTWALEIEAKLACSLQFLHSFKQQADITNTSKQNYPEVWERIEIVQNKNHEKLKKQYRTVKKLLHVASSAVLSQAEHDFKIAKLFSFGISFPQYLIMSQSAKLKSLQYYRKPKLETAQLLWNLQQNGATRQFSKLIFEGIKTNRKIYVPADGIINNRTDILKETPNTITVRILYNKKLKIFSEGQSMTCCYKPQKQTKYIDTIILHMHGGGFIALSSRSMQVYTRKWANQLNIPIFSVDYRMPPDHPFPQAPHDCFVVYQFLLNYVHQYMNIRPKNIYIAGDSAGGNLAFSLTGLIMKHKLPNPRGIYASYPATDLRLMFSESRLHSINDVLLWPSTLLLCLTTYLQGDFKKGQDPLASPSLLTEQYVNGKVGDKRFPLNWPKTIITVGSKDPLLDDSLIMMEKMVASKVDCRLIVYEDLTHGYLNTGQIIDASQKAVDQSVGHLKQLLKTHDQVVKLPLDIKSVDVSVQQIKNQPQQIQVPKPHQVSEAQKKVQAEKNEQKPEIVEPESQVIKSKGLESTKDPQVAENANKKEQAQEGQQSNFKVTTSELIQQPQVTEVVKQA